MIFDNIKPKIVTNLKSAELLVIAEKAMFLSTAQRSENTESDFLARLREVARNCKLDNLSNSADIAAELIELQFVAIEVTKEKHLIF